MSNNTLELWTEIKTLVESVEGDVNKHAKGNASAGVRARKGLRLLRNKTSELVKATLGKEEDPAE